MKFTLLVVGRTLQKHFLRGISDYMERIKHYIPFETEIIPEPKSAKRLHEDQQKEKEGDSILKVLRQGDVPILLDERGEEFRSVEFAAWLNRQMQTTNKRLVFIVGGPYGFSEKVYAAAQGKIALSRMTFSHQMIRLVFVEQLYRAMTILKGEPYHHE